MSIVRITIHIKIVALNKETKWSGKRFGKNIHKSQHNYDGRTSAAAQYGVFISKQEDFAA